MKKFPRINNEDGINTLCRMTTELEYDDIPAEVIELAKELILDTVGCMIGGHGQHPPRQEAPPPAGGTAALQGLQSLIKLLGECVLRLLGRFEKGVVIVKD